MSLLSLPITIVRTPLAVASAVVSGPARLLRRLDKALDHLEEMADGVNEMRADMVRMRTAIEESVAAKLDGLRTDVRAMDGNVDGIRAATQSLDVRVDQLAETLAALDGLTARLAWLGGRRKRPPATAPDLAG